MLPSETPPQPPAPPSFPWLRSALVNAAKLIMVTIIAGGVAYAVFEYRIRQEQQGVAAQVATLREDLTRRQQQLEQQIQRVEQAAAEASLLLQQDGSQTSLGARLREIDALKLELKKTQEELSTKLADMEKSVVEQVARQGQETAQALSLELRWKSLLIKAQGEVLLAQFYLAEGNRGLAKDEVGTAIRSLTQAQEEAPEEQRTAISQVVDLAEQSRTALILEQSSARDSLNLLWHRVSDLLAPVKQP